MNNGRKTEKLVRLIQETLKDFPNTKIFSNYKIENISGRTREIDVLLKSTINNFEIIIAIECKDYKTSISVEKIEAFNSKCQRIRGISKKIFVATNGYQKDALAAAKDFDIELYNLNEINTQEIFSWIPIKQLKAKYLLKTPYKLKINAEQKDLETIPIDEELTIHFYDGRNSIILTGFLWNEVIYKNQDKLKSLLLYDFMKNTSNINYQTIIPYSMDFSGIYIDGEKGKKLDILRIDSEIVGWLEEIPAKIVEAKSYQKVDSDTIANILTIDADKNEFADIVFTNDNQFKIFHTNQQGQVKQMETLFEYDSKTDKLVKIKKSNSNQISK